MRIPFACSLLLMAVGLVACSADHKADTGRSIHPAAASESSPQPHRISVGGATIDISFEGDSTGIDPVSLDAWIDTAAGALTHYFGRFPVKHLSLFITFDGEDTVHNGITYDGDRIKVRVGRRSTKSAFETDWILTHEMFHLALASQDSDHHWMEEGLSTYLEPVARARVGNLAVEQFWLETVEGMPQGLPAPGDGGLDGTSVWGRTYWGGAMFWLIADLRIREQTANQQSLDTAIRAILEAGGNGSVDWPATKVFEFGDKATGTHVLSRLYSEMGRHPVSPDLSAIWQRLGVKKTARGVTFDDLAPLAAIRRSITSQ